MNGSMHVCRSIRKLMQSTMTKFLLVKLFLAVCWTVVLASGQECQEGWYLFNKSCYRTGGKWDWFPFEKAQYFCKEKGGHLVEINSARENEFLVQLKKKLNVDYLWIGLSDQAEEGTFRWYASGDDVNYKNWEDGQPDAGRGKADEDCALMEVNGKWVDVPCKYQQPFFCESEL